jgi:hypothetical protein
MFSNVILLNQQNPICKHKIKVELFLENTSNIIHSFDVIIVFNIYLKDIIKEVIRQLNTNQTDTLYYKIMQNDILIYDSSDDEKAHIYHIPYRDDIPLDREHLYMHIYKKTDDKIYNISNNYIIDETIEKISFQIYFDDFHKDHQITFERKICKVNCSTVYYSIKDLELHAGTTTYFDGYSSDEYGNEIQEI